MLAACRKIKHGDGQSSFWAQFLCVGGGFEGAQIKISVWHVIGVRVWEWVSGDVISEARAGRRL